MLYVQYVYVSFDLNPEVKLFYLGSMESISPLYPPTPSITVDLVKAEVVILVSQFKNE